MLKARKEQLLCVLALSLLLTGIPRVEANKHVLFPSSQKVIYFLDVSGSGDSKYLWSVLRNSVLERVQGAMGAPKRDGLTLRQPTDLTISTINANSGSSQLIEILSIKDAERIWAFMIETVGGGNPSAGRMKPIYQDFFGGAGAYSILINEYVQDGTLAALSRPQCERRALEIFKDGQWMRNESTNLKTQAAKEVCTIVLKLNTGLKNADAAFLSAPGCKGKCSDIVGAVKKAAAASRDLGRGSKLCVAIASDMLNNSLPSGPWHTFSAIKGVATDADARRLGEVVGAESGIFFPKRVGVKVEIIGQGGDMPPNLTSKLNAYWGGFWYKVGIKNSGAMESLDEACKPGKQ